MNKLRIFISSLVVSALPVLGQGFYSSTNLPDAEAIDAADVVPIENMSEADATKPAHATMDDLAAWFLSTGGLYLVDNTVWSDDSQATLSWTFDTTGTADPVIAFSSDPALFTFTGDLYVSGEVRSVGGIMELGSNATDPALFDKSGVVEVKDVQDTNYKQLKSGQLTLADDAILPPLNLTGRTSPPSSPTAGDVYLDDGTNTLSGNTELRVFNGISWDDLGGGSFSATALDAVTWSDGANASNIWTFDLSGTDPTLTFGSGVITAKDAFTVKGPVATAGILTLQTAETTVDDNDVLGKIDFQAPDEADGTDAIVVGASIQAEAAAEFNTTTNVTDLVFTTDRGDFVFDVPWNTNDTTPGVGTYSDFELSKTYGRARVYAANTQLWDWWNNRIRAYYTIDASSTSVHLGTGANPFGRLYLDGYAEVEGYIDMTENGDPGSPAANIGRIYVDDNGSGTTTPYFQDSAGTVTSLLGGAPSYATSITASTTQSQGQQPLTADYNVVTVVANDLDTVTLPAATAGEHVWVENADSTQALQIFPASGDDLGYGANASCDIPKGVTAEFRCFVSGTWERRSVDLWANASDDSFNIRTDQFNGSGQLRIWDEAHYVQLQSNEAGLSISSTGASAANRVTIGSTNTPDTTLDVHGAMTIRELSSDPADPDEGATVIWQSDGTGFGSDGDLVVKITAGGVTKTVTLIDFSAATDEEP